MVSVFVRFLYKDQDGKLRVKSTAIWDGFTRLPMVGEQLSCCGMRYEVVRVIHMVDEVRDPVSPHIDVLFLGHQQIVTTRDALVETFE